MRLVGFPLFEAGDQWQTGTRDGNGDYPFELEVWRLIAAQTVGGFTQVATATVSGSAPDIQVAWIELQIPETEPYVAPDPGATEKRRGGGGWQRARFRVLLGEEWVDVPSAQAAQDLIAQVEAQAKESARKAAVALASRPKVRTRAAMRAAPVVRVEALEGPPELLLEVQDNVERVNARLREMYVAALRVEMIGKLLRQRLEEDEDEALMALMD